ncbi:MAG TPA: hemerythrin domain-containing protein [Alphaproteobacteria bacterium]|nr:hemerythrin domain-containing protein [Alphaproteobacteria bacterium]
MLLDHLRRDHREVLDLLKVIGESDDARECGALFNEFRNKMLAHAHAEQKVLYAPMRRDEEFEDTILEAIVEHEVAEDLIEQLSRARGKASAEWHAKCTVLKEMIEHHVEEEESEIFPAAQNMFDARELEEMAEKFQGMKEKEQRAA